MWQASYNLKVIRLRVCEVPVGSFNWSLSPITKAKISIMQEQSPILWVGCVFPFNWISDVGGSDFCTHWKELKDQKCQICQSPIQKLNSTQKLKHFQISLNKWFLIGKRSLDRISVDRNCVLSLDWNCGNHLIEFHLIESVDRKF